ncbi:PAAR-like domain-containing protein [Rhizobacter sp. SG703]|uniref:PAAR-like domain-containing protein n=1 Tax=Rhizobacter sp. SG703 TaxID=2587140 RepID=UPI001447572F|nr:PAAR-like domain-containing protein [Rhizobacter sp. SG703]NKI95264.1 putative Zn-binding protein involved in type VI secretion [Rhizobacter sp. SG703]
MNSVAIHPPKTPVTEGSLGTAKATLPNICKMPAPPAPFVPAPLPNIAKSNLSPQGYSTSVTIEGHAVAIRGAMFESIGDMASKGTGGGLISANTHGPAKFISPGSMTVKIEGKSVHLLGEPMLNNCGPSGSPSNTGATMAGVDQSEREIDDCPGHEIEFSELTDDAEKKRREELEAARKQDLANSDEAAKLAALHEKTGRPKLAYRGKDNLDPAALMKIALDDEGYAEDKAFEQKVAEDVKAVWTNIKYKCKHCKLHGEIDIVMPSGAIKECKRPGTIKADQVKKYSIAGPALLGGKFKGVHQAIPGDKVATLRKSAASQRLEPGKDFHIQPH